MKIFFLVLSALFISFWATGFRINVTPSLPLGLYRLSDILAVGGSTIFCLESPEFIHLAKERGYVGFGLCPGGIRPLGKEIYGLTGDVVGLTNGLITVNGRILAGSGKKDKDRKGRAMPVSQLQPGVIPKGYALMLSLHHCGSFDSRYFGLVRLAEQRPVVPVLTWNEEDHHDRK